MSHFDYPVLDGIAPSYADINVRISPNGGTLVEMGDIAEISTGTTVEVGEQLEGGRVIKRTRGSVKYEASWKLYASGYQKLMRGLMSAAPSNSKGQKLLSLAHYLVHVVWTPPGSTDLLEYKIKGCRVLGRTIASAEGNDAQQVEMSLSTIEVVDVIDGIEVIMV